MKKIVLTILLVIWMALIFWFSNQGSVKSTEKSQSFVRNTIVTIYKLFDSNASEEKLETIVEMFDVPVRKVAHFTEYFILGILVFFTFRSYGIKNIYIMIAFCFIYSCSDEIHQLFVPGRSGNLIDVILDSLGSFSSIIFFNRK